MKSKVTAVHTLGDLPKTEAAVKGWGSLPLWEGNLFDAILYLGIAL